MRLRLCKDQARNDRFPFLVPTSTDQVRFDRKAGSLTRSSARPLFQQLLTVEQEVEL
jgi:hypothetical protein